MSEIREALCEFGYEDSIVLENPSFDNSIIGISDDGRVVYNFNEMVKELMENENMSESEAIEFIEYNTLRAIPYMGKEAPIVMRYDRENLLW